MNSYHYNQDTKTTFLYVSGDVYSIRMGEENSTKEKINLEKHTPLASCGIDYTHFGTQMAFNFGYLRHGQVNRIYVLFHQ